MANLLGAPATVFNGALGRRRQMAFASLPLDDVKRIAKDRGIKVNDVVMTVLAGAAHTYLEEVSAVPTSPINVFMAVSTSIADDEGHSNKVASVPISLPVNLTDPVERLDDIFESTSHAKVLLNAMRAHKIQSIGAVAPPVLLNLASQALARAEISSRLPAAAAFVVSNIPGPPIPLYSAGSKVMGIFAGSVLLANGALNVTLMSYNGRLDFGFTVDPDIVPKVHHMANALPGALQDLMTALDMGPMSEIEDAWA
jgi:WS/DGAT/MGAT family acyltransferase